MGKMFAAAAVSAALVLGIGQAQATMSRAPLVLANPEMTAMLDEAHLALLNAVEQVCRVEVDVDAGQAPKLYNVAFEAPLRFAPQDEVYI